MAALTFDMKRGFYMGKLEQSLLIVANLGILARKIVVDSQTRRNNNSVSDRLAITNMISQYAYRWDSWVRMRLLICLHKTR